MSTTPRNTGSESETVTENGSTVAAPRKKPKAWVRLVIFGAVMLTAWQVLASFLWIAPYSENAREIVPGGQNTLSSYMLPFFGQSWSVFAPEPINGDYHFNVRAKTVDEDGKEIETGWVSATDVEISMIQYNLFPPRAGLQSNELASNYKNAYDRLESVQKLIVGEDFDVDAWEIGLESALNSQPGETSEGDKLDPNLANIEEMMAQEHMATAYATQVARAIFGEDVTQVQIRVSRQNIIPFAERHNPDAVRPEPTVVLPGWRLPVVEAGQSDENFANVFRKQFERNN